MSWNDIAIVGLGLIGGSLLKALQGFCGANIYGIDTDEAVLRAAREEKLIANGTLTNEEILKKADLVLVCLHPDLTIQYINENSFKPGALVSDVCGVKEILYENITNHDVDFIGGHPMAGKEASGYFASDKNLFCGAAYLLTPTHDNQPEHITLLQKMTAYIGCRETVLTTPKEHDAMIAYTSQLMHVVAIALCDNERLSKAKNFSAGSLRDCTRVAKLDSRLWSRLFLMNKAELSLCIDVFSDSLQKIKHYIDTEDEAGLEAFLKQATKRKETFLKETKNKEQ